MSKRHVADGFYIKTACGRFVPADSDTQFTQANRKHAKRTLCKACIAAEKRAENQAFYEWHKQLEADEKAAAKKAKLDERRAFNRKMQDYGLESADLGNAETLAGDTKPQAPNPNSEWALGNAAYELERARKLQDGGADSFLSDWESV